MFPISSWRESLRSARAARSLRRGLGDICLRRIIGSFSISWCFIWLFSRPFRPEGCGLCCLRCLRPPFRPCCMEWGDRISGMFPIWPFRWERPSGFMKKGCWYGWKGSGFGPCSRPRCCASSWCPRQCGSVRCCFRREEEESCSWRQTPFFPSGSRCFPGL